MKVIHCDICGKELASLEAFNTISFDSSRGQYRSLNIGIDMCGDCAIAVRTALNKLVSERMGAQVIATYQCLQEGLNE